MDTKPKTFKVGHNEAGAFAFHYNRAAFAAIRPYISVDMLVTDNGLNDLFALYDMGEEL